MPWVEHPAAARRPIVLSRGECSAPGSTRSSYLVRMAGAAELFLVVALKARGLGFEARAVASVAHHPAGRVRHLDTAVAFDAIALLMARRAALPAGRRALAVGMKPVRAVGCRTSALVAACAEVARMAVHAGAVGLPGLGAVLSNPSRCMGGRAGTPVASSAVGGLVAPAARGSALLRGLPVEALPVRRMRHA